MSASLDHLHTSVGSHSFPPNSYRSRQSSGKGQQLLVPIYDVDTGQIAFPEDRYRSVRRSLLGMELLFMPPDTDRSSRHGSGVGGSSARDYAPYADDRRRSSSGHSLQRERERERERSASGQKGRTRNVSGSTSTSTAGGLRRSSGLMSSSGGTSRGTSASRPVRKSSTGRDLRLRGMQPEGDDGEDEQHLVSESQPQKHQKQHRLPHGLECRLIRTRSGVPRVVRPATAYWSHTPRADNDPATFRAVLDALERGVHLMRMKLERFKRK